MRIEPLGDLGWTLRDLPGPAYVVAEALRDLRLPGVTDVAASYETVGIYGAEPGAVDAQAIETALSKVGSFSPGGSSCLHTVPVCYELGGDLDQVSQLLGLSVEQIIKLHGSCEYTCYAVGFCPGFAYLGWLPEKLSGVPRRPQPRVRVEPGSVGITGRQTAVYPLVRPGGWALIGRTPLTLVDETDGYFPIKAGDRIRFVPLGLDEFKVRQGQRL